VRDLGCASRVGSGSGFGKRSGRAIGEPLYSGTVAARDGPASTERMRRRLPRVRRDGCHPEPAVPEQTRLTEVRGSVSSPTSVARFQAGDEFSTVASSRFAHARESAANRRPVPWGATHGPRSLRVLRSVRGDRRFRSGQGAGCKISMGHWGPGALASFRSPVSRVVCMASARAT